MVPIWVPWMWDVKQYYQLRRMYYHYNLYFTRITQIPLNPVTTLRYNLPEDAIVNLTIYDMMGRQVSTLVSSEQSAGYKSVQWNAVNDAGAPVSAGLSLYRIRTGKFVKTHKMVLLK